MYHLLKQTFFLLQLIFITQRTSVNAVIVPKLLLPFHGNYQVNYTINAEEGCYRWKSLREEVASIEPVESTFDSVNMCSRSAVVVVRSTQPIRKTTLVLATNVKTGTVFQCDVIVDKIHTIDIISRTRELYLSDPPEELRIRALDQEGNTFSSTEGMVFEWSLAQDEGAKSKKLTKDEKNQVAEKQQPLVSAHSILLIQKFLETVYVGEPYVNELEERGKMADTILISGIQTGTAVVVADLISTLECHKTVDPVSVHFVVRDKITLNPPQDIYLLRHAFVLYKVERWRQGKSTEIAMPSSQYTLHSREISAEKSPVINLDTKTCIVTGVNNGHSQVYLIDQHLKYYDDSLMEQATSDVYVCEAAYLRFEIEPYNKWVLEVDRTYVIIVNMYSEENKKIWPADNVRVAGTLDDEYLETLETVNNGTWFLVRTVKRGSCEISSLLKGVVMFEGSIVKAGMFVGAENIDLFESPIFTTQTLEIFDRITVEPPLVLFPWEPDPVHYRYRFRATGGSGNYTWSVNETEASNITYAGVLDIQSGREEMYQPRTVQVKATDIRNVHHYGEARAIMAPPVKLFFALSILEAEVDTAINLYVAMYARIDKELLPFTDCSNTKNNLQWVIHDSSVFEFSDDTKPVPEEIDDPKPSRPPCLMRQIRALKEGHTTISLTYRHEEMNDTLQSSTVVAAYNPIEVIDPPQLAVVSLDSSKNLIFRGGPNPWPLLPNNHERLISSENGFLQLHPKVSGKNHLFVAHCIQLGTSTVTLTIQNQPCATNPHPRKAQIVIQVACAIPASLKLSTQYLPPSCPLYQSQNTQNVVLGSDTLQVTLAAYDNLGNQFDNFTSLAAVWRIMPNYLKALKTNVQFLPDQNGQHKHFVEYDFGIPSDLGDASLDVHIEEYQKDVKKSICAPHNCLITPPVKTSMVLVIVGPVSLSPRSFVMFNRPNYSMPVEITGGSGHFEHVLKAESGPDGAILEVRGDSQQRNLMLYPLNAGRASLRIYDICIPKATTVDGAYPRSDITVSDVSSLFLSANTLLEIGTSDEATVQLDLKELSIPSALQLSIQLSTEPEGIVVAGPTKKEQDELIFKATISALQIGSVSLKATTYSRTEQTITSNIVKVTVFPPLQLLPHRITVIRGSEFHLYVEGGPPEDVQLQYDVEDTHVASASSSGVLSAHNIGNTSVRVRAITKDGQVFHAQTATLVYVVQIKGVWIDTPSYRFHTGATVPVHVYGSAGPGYDPVSLDSDAAGLIFNWKVNNHAVLSLRSVHSEVGVEIADTLKFTMLLNGVGQGQSSVSVSVSATHVHLGQLAEPVLEAEIQVNVFDTLSVQNLLDKRWTATNSLLLTPKTTYNILSNRDVLADKMDYNGLQKSCDVAMTLPEKDEDCITINEELKSLTTSGQPCEATLLVTAHEHFNAAQTVAIHVRVKTISYVMAVIKNRFYVRDPDTPLRGFPLGSLLTLEVQQFDNFGARFDASRPDTKYTTNRNDLLEITPNGTTNLLSIKTSWTGVTIFSVWSGKDTNYFFPLNVVSTIPGEGEKNSLFVGVKKCFASQLVNAEGKPGKWLIGKHKSFVIDQNTGAVLPLTRATDDLVYKLPPVQSKLALSADAFWIKFDENHLPEFITTAKSRYVFPILVSDEAHDDCLGLDDELATFAKDTFDCSGVLLNTVDPLKIFDASPEYMSDINSYACVFDLINHDKNTQERISTFDASFTLTLAVRPWVAERGISLQSAINMKFVPAFKVMNESEIVLFKSRPGTLCVSATSEVHKSIEMTSSIRDIEIDVPDTFFDGVVCYGLKYKNAAGNKGYTNNREIRIHSTVTQQNEVVAVRLQDTANFIQLSKPTVDEICSDPQPAGSWITHQYYSYTYLSFLVALLVILFTTLIILITCGFFKWAFSEPPPPTSPDLTFTRPMRSSGLTPYSPSNNVFRRRSPGQRPSPQSSKSSNSPSPGRVRLWSTYYEPQDAGLT